MSKPVVIEINNVSKRFKLFNNKKDQALEALFPFIHRKHKNFFAIRDFSLEVNEGDILGIIGRNGSGKSTLLQVIAGSIHPTEGTVRYVMDGNAVRDEHIFRYISCSAPYLELIEEFRLMELLQFHFRFKKILPGYTVKKITGMLGFKHEENKAMRLFSSGMKQRVKLILAFLSDTPLLLLDEPTNNLDQAGIDWYLNLIDEFSRPEPLQPPAALWCSPT